MLILLVLLQVYSHDEQVEGFTLASIERTTFGIISQMMWQSSDSKFECYVSELNLVSSTSIIVSACNHDFYASR